MQNYVGYFRKYTYLVSNPLYKANKLFINSYVGLILMSCRYLCHVCVEPKRMIQNIVVLLGPQSIHILQVNMCNHALT